MIFTDKDKQTFQSLLDSLRTIQDGSQSQAQQPANQSQGQQSQQSARQTELRQSQQQVDPSRARQSVSPTRRSWARAAVPVSTASTAAADAARSQKIRDLLAQLEPDPAPQRRGSAFDGPSHTVMDAFGPVGQTAGPSAWGGTSTSSYRQPPSVESYRPGGPDMASSAASAPKRKADELDDRADWAFTRCLPFISDLLRDDEFVKELRKMKAEQHALERRMWARMEKVKADHASSKAPEREVARIRRQVIPPEKQAQWQRELRHSLKEFFAKQLLPSMDGLAARHRARLVELGVPGLGSPQDETNSSGVLTAEAKAATVRTNERIKRIMDVLEGAIDDSS